MLVRGEVSKPAVVEELASHGPYRVVVHNAATGVVRPALETEDKHWDWTLNANARALLSLARATAPQMEEGSSIVAISSLGSTRVLENYVLIGTSKAALESIVRYLAVELSPGIRVNAVSGGVVDTGALEHFPNKDEMLRSVERTPGRPPRRARGHCGRRVLSLFAGRVHDPWADARRRRRLLAPGLTWNRPSTTGTRSTRCTATRRLARPGLPPIVKATLGDLTGKKVLHLHCGSGEASADLGAQGAIVTAVDPSERLLDDARAQWPKILWIQAERGCASRQSFSAAASISCTRRKA